LILAWSTYQYEADVPAQAKPPKPQQEQQAAASQMEDESFWRGEGQVRRLALLHVAVGIAASAGILLGVAIWADHSNEMLAGGRPWLASVSAGFLGSAVGAAVWLLATTYVARREKGATTTGWKAWSVLSAATAGTIGTVSYLLLNRGVADLRPAHPTLPGYGGAITWLFVVQLLILIVIAALSRSGGRGAIALLVAVLAGVLLAINDVRDVVGDSSAGRAGVTLAILAVTTVIALTLPASKKAAPAGDWKPAWGGRRATRKVVCAGHAPLLG